MCVSGTYVRAYLLPCVTDTLHVNLWYYVISANHMCILDCLYRHHIPLPPAPPPPSNSPFFLPSLLPSPPSSPSSFRAPYRKLLGQYVPGDLLASLPTLAEDRPPSEEMGHLWLCYR